MPSIRRVVPNIIRRNYTMKFVLVLLLMGFTVGAVGYVGTEYIADDVQERAEADQRALAETEVRTIEGQTKLAAQTVETFAVSVNSDGVVPRSE